MWGKIIGGMAGLAMGGPFGAVVGMALGHAAESGGAAHLGSALRNGAPHGLAGFTRQGARDPRERMRASAGAGRGTFSDFDRRAAAASLGGRDQVFATCVVVLSAKLAKCDGPVTRAEIDAFKRSVRIPPQSMAHVAHLFDRARASPDGFEGFADQLADHFADAPAVLEEVLTSLFSVAIADAPVNAAEQRYLMTVCHRFGLDRAAWERASGQRARRVGPRDDVDPYQMLGVRPDATDAALRDAWKRLMRENHPDSLAARGAPADAIARSSDKVARINAAWDRIKRERGL